MDAILEMHIGDPRRNDQLVWPSTKTSMYSVKSGYHWAQSRHCSPRGQHPSSSNSSMDHVCKVVWKLKTPPKLHNFMWRTLHGALATMENLFKRKCSASPMCPICNCHEEFIEDLLLLCLWVETIWYGGVLNYKVDKHEITSWAAWLHSIASRQFGSKEDQGFVLSHVAFTCWYIWKERCNFLFNQQAPNPTQVLLSISNYSAIFIEATRFLLH